MNYEKKLALAKEALESGSYDKETIEYIFPELKECEDEKIRKELVFYLGDMPEDTELRNGVTNRDVLAWLEKQGEQKPLVIDEGCIHMGISGCCRYCNTEKECKNNSNYENKKLY